MRVSGLVSKAQGGGRSLVWLSVLEDASRIWINQGGGMLTGSVVTTILQVSEAAPAVEFYRDRLGLGYQGRNSEGQEIFALGGGASLALMPDPEATPTGRTEISFEVADIAAEIRDLGQRGVTFANYDLP